MQGFPDTFELPLADTHLYKQFGNSVTVNVIEAIAKCILDVLEHPEKTKANKSTKTKSYQTQDEQMSMFDIN